MQQRIIDKLTTLAVLITGLGFIWAVAPASSASAATIKCVDRTFSIAQENTKDPCVKYIQRMLNSNNGSKLAIDGYYGPKTTAQVEYYQKHHTNLKADGVVGNDTWSNLCANQDKYKSTAKSAGCTMTPTSTSNSTTVFKPVSQTQKRGPTKGCDAYSYHQGDKNACVKRIQELFNTAGAQLEVDGEYGPKTARIVKTWQEVFKVKGDKAGVMGTNTWDSVCFWDGHVPGQNDVSSKTMTNWRVAAARAGCIQ